jgi:MoaA/NifB/PqqE/SkfB family radical SAM enzyme
VIADETRFELRISSQSCPHPVGRRSVMPQTCAARGVMLASVKRVPNEQTIQGRGMDTLIAEPVTASPASFPFPETFTLDWTDYCNAKCFFCPREEYEKRIGGSGGFIAFKNIMKLEPPLRAAKYFRITSGIGEPLLHPEVENILEWLYTINPAILLQVVTNGTTLTKDKAAWFAGHLDWLSVSLNAGNAEAHMRDMFSHLAKRGIDPQKRWELQIGRLTEFLGALPRGDRARVRFQMVTHRDNIKDMPEFVRLVSVMGGSQAVITNICVHPETVNSSLYWVRDLYNDIVEEACETGARLGVQVHAVRFFTHIKPQIDLDKVCRDPIDIAYVSRSSEGAPCCHWAEKKFPVDIYDRDDGFEQYWNNDTLRRLRQKRDFVSCLACGMSRVFDEMSFHFSPKLKETLIAERRISEVDSNNDYPDALLVRRCVENRLDLPSIRRSLLRLNLKSEMTASLEHEGLAALPALDRACWAAFRATGEPANRIDLSLAGSFIGIGWGPPIYDPQNRLSARWIAAGNVASVFVRVLPGISYGIRLTFHHLAPAELAEHVKLAIGDRVIETGWSVNKAGRAVLRAKVPDDLVRANGGRLWLRIGCLDPSSEPVSGQMSVMNLVILDHDISTIEASREEQTPFVRAIVAGLEQGSRSQVSTATH